MIPNYKKLQVNNTPSIYNCTLSFSVKCQEYDCYFVQRVGGSFLFIIIFYSFLLKKIFILAFKVQHICYKVGFQTEEFNSFGHYHGNVITQAQEISWVLFFLFLFSKHSTGDSFSKFRYVPGTRTLSFQIRSPSTFSLASLHKD